MRDEDNADLVERGSNSDREAIRTFFQRGFRDSRYSTTKHSIYTKLQSLLNSEVFYNLMCGESTIDLEEAIAKRKIIVCNLAKGRLGEAVSEAFGRFVISTVQSIALRRHKVAKRKRVPTHLFIDEAQNYITKSTLSILRETRKFALFGTLAQPGTGLDMSPAVRDQVLNLTNVKFVGKTPEPKEQRYLGQLLDIEPGGIARLRTGEFYVQSGNNPTFKLYTASHLADTANRMTTPSWRRVVRRQTRAYYRPLSFREPDAEALDGSEMRTDEVKPRQKRRLV